jgi:hypothetical protein
MRESNFQISNGRWRLVQRTVPAVMVKRYEATWSGTFAGRRIA